VRSSNNGNDGNTPGSGAPGRTVPFDGIDYLVENAEPLKKMADNDPELRRFILNRFGKQADHERLVFYITAGLIFFVVLVLAGIAAGLFIKGQYDGMVKVTGYLVTAIGVVFGASKGIEHVLKVKANKELSALHRVVGKGNGADGED